jgi:transketolase
VTGLDLARTAKEIRRSVVNLACVSKSPHVGPSLSCVDILTALYFDVMKMESIEEQDVFILSKGHAAMALYATLVERGIMKRAMLEGYYKNDGTLPAHLDRFKGSGVWVSSGSLGHGFNVGLGMAYGFKKSGSKRQVYALIGDGESEEGSIWEGALFAPRLGLGNFTAILDYNDLQGYGRPSELCSFEPVAKKWQAFGWFVLEVDGHNHQEIVGALRHKYWGKPTMVIAHTVKGKGVSFMEDCMEWHFYVMSETNRDDALKELR